jgi:hypothetical protein
VPRDPFAERDDTAGETLRLPPWEQRERYGLLNALYLTVKEALLAPGQFFQRMPTRLGLVQPLLFGVVLTFVSAFFDFMWSLTGGSVQRLIDRGDISDFVRAPVVLGGIWVLSPLVAVVQIVVRAAVFHLGLILCGGNRLGFEATFRVVAYSRAASIISLLPFCGGLAGLIWEIAITIVGLARIHGVEEWRPVVAVLLPLAVLLLSCGGLLALIIGAGLFG